MIVFLYFFYKFILFNFTLNDFEQRFGLWLALRTINDFTYVLTYLITYTQVRRNSLWIFSVCIALFYPRYHHFCVYIEGFLSFGVLVCTVQH